MTHIQLIKQSYFFPPYALTEQFLHPADSEGAWLLIFVNSDFCTWSLFLSVFQSQYLNTQLAFHKQNSKHSATAMSQNDCPEKYVWWLASCFSQQKFTDASTALLQRNVWMGLCSTKDRWPAFLTLLCSNQLVSAFTVISAVTAGHQSQQLANEFMPIAPNEDVSANCFELIFPHSQKSEWERVVRFLRRYGASSKEVWLVSCQVLLYLDYWNLQ